jgi:hypothetical protein
VSASTSQKEHITGYLLECDRTGEATEARNTPANSSCSSVLPPFRFGSFNWSASSRGLLGGARDQVRRFLWLFDREWTEALLRR